MGEKFNLRWNDFQSNVSKSFGLFRNESYLHDVTLVSEDFKHIPAHKLVLSACSEYFRNILKQTNKQSQTLLCLDGVNADDLRNVLDYVYEGEVKISQEDIDRFLGIAQKLKLEGLINYGDNTEDETMTLEETSKEDFHQKQELEDSPVGPPSIVRRTQSKPRSQENTVMVIQNGETLNDADHKQRLDDNIVDHPDDNKSVSCKICNRVFSSPVNRGTARRNARRHVEVHIEGLTYNCPQCDKSFRSKNSLHIHKYRCHC